jgi:hypothetical protein
MAGSWSIKIEQLANGLLTFTPDLPGAKVGQPLGVSKGDNVTWDNQIDQKVVLKSIQPPDPAPPKPPILPFDSIPPGSVSDPILNVTETIGYSWVRPLVVAPKSRSRKVGSSGSAHSGASTPAAPDAWIVVV